MASVEVVTGYVPIQGHPRTAAQYGAFGEVLFKPLSGATMVRPFYETLDMCWLWKYVGNRKNVSHSAGDNSAKNSLAYHCVQHQKFAWLLKAAIEKPQIDTFVWIDYGIAHIPGITPEIVYDFIKKVEGHPGDFAIPGCHDMHPDNIIVNDYFPCWRFCGGVLVVPRDRVHKLYKAIKRTALTHIDKTRNVTWEVNTMAEAEKTKVLPKFRWYQADHNATMFTGYQP